MLFDPREFRAGWFETGTPTFLVDWLKARTFFTPCLERWVTQKDLLSAFDVEAIAPEAMLWHTGYVTLHQRERFGAYAEYTLGLPNQEVRSALNRLLLATWHPQGASAQRIVSMR